jgi:inhibitor of KinA sporulation pathway (predicted exonuclease)
MEAATKTDHLGKKESLDVARLVLVVDLEATCCNQGSVPQREMEIIQIGAVLATRSGELLGEWSSHVRPIRHPVLTTFCTQLTGISQFDVDSADTFPAVIERLVTWMDDSSKAIDCWASWGAYDRHQLQQDLAFHGVPWCLPSTHVNLKAVFAKTFRLKKRPALSTALAVVGQEFSGTPHDALDDARNAARLLQYAWS